jgi:hypothetical protein
LLSSCHVDDHGNRSVDSIRHLPIWPRPRKTENKRDFVKHFFAFKFIKTAPYAFHHNGIIFYGQVCTSVTEFLRTSL